MATQLINGITVELDGQGDALLCIHGLGGSSHTWTPLRAAFEGMQVIRPDLPGSARSALPAGKLSIAGYVTALARLLADLHIASAHIVAHSLGTIVAQHPAVHYPAKVKSLALFGPLAAPPEAARPNIAARAASARGGVAAMQEIADAIVNAATSKETRAEQPAVLAVVRESVMRQPPEGYAQSCEALAEAQSAVSTDGARIIDGKGRFLMPGLTEAHTHFSWNDQPSLAAIQFMPPEEHTLWCVWPSATSTWAGPRRSAPQRPSRGWTWCCATRSTPANSPARATWPVARKSPPSVR